MDATNEHVNDALSARREEWRRIAAEQAASGKTITAFCLERGLPQWKFHYWRKALSSCAESSDAKGFVQLKISPAHERGSQVWLETGAWRVCVAPGFDVATLQRVLVAVAQT